MGAAGDDANTPELVRLLHAKEERVHSLQLQLEEERRLRRAAEHDASAKRAALEERHGQTSDELNRQLRARDEQVERLRDEHRGKSSGLEAQVEVARQREAELLKRNDQLISDVRRLLACAESDHAQNLALQAKVDALSAEVEELRALLRTSDEVTRSLKHEAAEQTQLKERVRAELGELHLVERAGRDSSRSTQERLSAQCEAMTRQASEHGRKVDTLEDQARRAEEAHREECLQHEIARRKLQERYCEAEAKIAVCNEHVSSLNDELSARRRVETALRESAAALETRIEEHKDGAQRLQTDLMNQKMSTDARSQEVEAGSLRERALKNTVAALEERVACARNEYEVSQSSLLATRSQLQHTDLELQGANENTAACRRELARAVSLEQDTLRDCALRSEDRVAQRDNEIHALQEQLLARRGDLRDRSAQMDRAEVAHSEHKHELLSEIGSWKVNAAGHLDTIDRIRGEHHTAEATTEQVRQQLRDRDLEFTSELASHKKKASDDATQAASEMDSLREDLNSELEAARKLWKQKLAEQRDILRQEAEKEVQAERSQRTLLGQRLAAEEQRIAKERHGSEKGRQALMRELVAEQAWRAEQEARKASAKEQEVMTSPRLLAGLKQEPGEEQGWSGEVAALHRSIADARAQLEWAVADDLRSALEVRAREAGCSGALGPHIPPPTYAGLKRLLLEFRQRIAVSLAEALAVAQTPDDARAVLVGVLGRGRRGFGRMLHASLFMYQKLRTLVPTELEEPLQDPVGKLMPLPFYVLPYKARLAVKLGPAALARGGRRGLGSSEPPRPLPQPPRLHMEPDLYHTGGDPVEARRLVVAARRQWITWLSGRLEDLEERLPLQAASPVEVPTFLERLLRIRAQASHGPDADADTAPAGDAATEAMLRDRLDVLLVDALTVFMSAWRTGSGPENPSPAAQRISLAA